MGKMGRMVWIRFYDMSGGRVVISERVLKKRGLGGWSVFVDMVR